MNGKICSIANPEVYYEETPDGLKELQRTASMVHLHPGYDFQCRCTMVMWDPELDGKYNVKQEPKEDPKELPKQEEPKELSPEQKELEATKKELAKEKEKTEKANAKKVEAERRLEIMRKANERHAKRNRTEIETRIKNRQERNKEYENLIAKASVFTRAGNSIKREKVNKLENKLTTEQIINRLGGGDLTKGSCASLALAYAANRAGYDVLDFRGGDSRKFFSRTSDITTKQGGFQSKGYIYNEKDLIGIITSFITENEEYYLSAYRHASIIRKRNGVVEYLELQNSSNNGWNILDEKILPKRFGGIETGFSPKCYINNIKNIVDSNKFKILMEFLNTKPKNQKKGTNGKIK